MKCAWDSLLAILPEWLRPEVDRLGRGELQELRLRLNRTPELVLAGKSQWLTRNMKQDDLNFCINLCNARNGWKHYHSH